MFKSIRLQQSIIERPSSKLDKDAYNTFVSFQKPKDSSCFALQSIISHGKLMNNKKFSQLVSNIKQYNLNLQKFGQQNIIQYKLYQFLYSCLCICTYGTKTYSQIESYLNLVHNWFNKYNTKRGLTIIHKKVKKKGNQDQIIRQTFKYNQSLQINQYKRRILDNYILKNDQKIFDQKKYQTNNQLCLPVFRSYRNNLINMMKQKQKKEQQLLKRDMKKNYCRVQSLTSNNFYKKIKNKNDIMSSKIKDKYNSNIENNNYIDTQQRFDAIKKYKFNQILRKKGIKTQSKSVIEQNIFKTIYENEKQNQIQNIDGLCLLKNPFQIQKKTKNKNLKTKTK